MSKKKELRGRPASSPIRENLVELIFFIRASYGYDLYKKYIKVFDQKVSMRSIYYHLNKGVELGEFRIQKIEEVKGDYSWGDQVKRIVFSLGPNANPRKSEAVFNKIKSEKIRSKY